jgi:hypothetical protein
MFPLTVIPAFAVRSPPILAVPVVDNVPPEMDSPEMFPVLLIPVFAVRIPEIVAPPLTVKPLRKSAFAPEMVSPPPEIVPVLLIPGFAVRTPPIFAVPLVVRVPPDMFPVT